MPPPGVRVPRPDVFGTNGTAIGLYDSLGYVVTSQQMRKTL